MTTFDVNGRAEAVKDQLRQLRLTLREQVLDREQTRAPDPLLTGTLAVLPLQVAEIAVAEATAELSATRAAQANPPTGG